MHLSLGRAWQLRAQGERHVGRLFRSLRDDLDRDPSRAIDVVRRGIEAAVAEEEEHFRLCHEAARSYGLQADEDREECFSERDAWQWHLQFIALALLSETCATHYLERCLSLTSDPASQQLLRALVRDEVGHAQLGWAHLLSLSRELRARLISEVPVLADNVRRSWHRRIDEIHVEALPAFGFPDASSSKALIDEVLASTVSRVKRS